MNENDLIKYHNDRTIILEGCAKRTNLLRTPPKAQGIKTSHSCTRSSFWSMASPPWKSFKAPLLFSLCKSKDGISSPFSFFTAPVMSLTAMTLPPLSWRSLATQEPTLPKPWKVIFDMNKDVYIDNLITRCLILEYYIITEMERYVHVTWITKVISGIDFPCSASKASVAKTTPRPVAASRPSDPPRSYSEIIRETSYIL